VVLGGRGPEGNPYTIFVKKVGSEYIISICDGIVSKAMYGKGEGEGVFNVLRMDCLKWSKGQSIANVKVNSTNNGRGENHTYYDKYNCNYSYNYNENNYDYL
jgi:hypothetical protein